MSVEHNVKNTFLSKKIFWLICQCCVCSLFLLHPNSQTSVIDPLSPNPECVKWFYELTVSPNCAGCLQFVYSNKMSLKNQHVYNRIFKEEQGFIMILIIWRVSLTSINISSLSEVMNWYVWTGVNTSRALTWRQHWLELQSVSHWQSFILNFCCSVFFFLLAIILNCLKLRSFWFCKNKASVKL